ncbi:MAG: DoxX family protein [Candidatus Omnitrophica bacterium]|nr:DoxX family protein [Candidatus Omnitrophota bacterium]
MIDLAILVLRVCLGVVFVAHGAQVAFGLFSGPGIGGFSDMLAGLGFKPALFWAYVGGYTELIGGAFLILGIFTRIAAFFILVFILVATLKVHLSKGFFIQAGGFEYNFVITCVCIALIILGTGKFGITDKF